MTTVEKEQFWTQIVENPSLWGTIQTSDKSFNTQAENIWTVMNETFIKNGSLKEVNRWELMLGDRLENSGEGTLNERKSRILKRITEHPPVTKGVVKESMDKNVSEKFGPVFHSAYDKYTDTFDFVVACKEEDKEAISELVSNVVPKIENVNITYNDLNKYADCATVADIKLINENYKEDLTTNGEWIYPLTNLTQATSLFTSADLRHIIFNAPNLKGGASIFDSCKSLLSIKAYIPKFQSGGTVHSNGLFMCASPLLEKCIISAIYEGVTTLGYFAVGCSSLREFSIPYLPKLSKIENGFAGTQLNKSSALKLLNQLPAYGSGDHPATIGIHVDNQTDEEVLAAIENAEAKGWTMTIQWNGYRTSTITSTFGLRKPMIYAKVVGLQSPNGEPKQDLDWGHYVTNWEENGYQEFSSLEEAYEHFGIEPEV